MIVKVSFGVLPTSDLLLAVLAVAHAKTLSLAGWKMISVSYTHLTLPTKRIV